jgi:hypothetical protein
MIAFSLDAHEALGMLEGFAGKNGVEARLPVGLHPIEPHKEVRIKRHSFFCEFSIDICLKALDRNSIGPEDLVAVSIEEARGHLREEDSLLPGTLICWIGEESMLGDKLLLIEGDRVGVVTHLHVGQSAESEGKSERLASNWGPRLGVELDGNWGICVTLRPCNVGRGHRNQSKRNH